MAHNNEKELNQNFLAFFSISLTIFSILLFGAVYMEEITILKAMVIWFFGAITIAFLIQFFFEVREKNLPGIEYYSGGLDGGVSGWQISRSMAYFLIIGIFGSLFTLTTLNFINEIDYKEKQGTPKVGKSDDKKSKQTKVINSPENQVTPSDSAKENSANTVESKTDTIKF